MRLLLAALLAASPGLAREQAPPTPLFASDAPVRLTIQGPIGIIARGAEDSTTARGASMTLVAPPETHAIHLSARGITRRKKQTCSFPPLRVELAQPASANSLFAGQRRLKLVTHCRASVGFQQHLLLEYAAYRLYNVLTPASFRVRLATVDYTDGSGKPPTSRLGFFIEDLGDAARRNGLAEARVGARIEVNQLEPRQAARVALFEYMIGNLDWSTRAGPPGDSCCHNSKLIGPGAAGKLIPLPYDFDFSGLVDAPYATPPEMVPVKSVRQRRYRGYCVHNAEAMAAAGEMRAKRGALIATLGQIPQMEPKTRQKAAAYLDGFFADIATDQGVAAKLLKTCIN